eukprot:SAG25_NODE_606_length_6610_cov_5.739671_2_plen_635_part_00
MIPLPPPPQLTLPCASRYPEVTEVMLLEVFNEVGPVASIRVCRDAVTRRSLGYAYVNFHNFVDAERALEIKNFFPVKGKPIRIMWSHRDPAIRKSGEGNIFIKNLDKRIDNKALFDTFSDYGNILSCKVAVDSNGESKGYGFIHFENTEAADNAIERVNGKSILERVVYVGHFRSRTERVAELGERANRFTNVYVKNLDKATSEEALREFGGQFGEVTSLTIMVDNDGGSRGFGFVNFASPEEAATAVEGMNGKTIGESTQEIYAGRAQKKEERSAELKKKFDTLRAERQQKYQGVNLFVKNLDEEVDDEKLRTEFAPFGTITSAKVMSEEKQVSGTDGGPPTTKTVSKGFGFVCFSTPEEATKAVTELNGRMIGTKPIYVALAQRKEARRAQLEAQMAQRQAQTMRHMQRLDMPPGAPMYPPGPMMYPPGMQMPGPPGRQVIYPQQMMNRPWRGPGGPRPFPGGPGGFPAGAMPGQMKPQRQQRGPRQQGGPGGFKGPKGGPPHMGYQGQPGMPPGMQPGMMQPGMMPPMQQQPPMPMQQQQQQPPPPQQESGGLTAASLAAAPQHQQKQMLGERLYPLIQQAQPELAGKITGMLLEMDNSELLLLLDDSGSLNEKIQEAIKVLDEHEKQQVA